MYCTETHQFDSLIMFQYIYRVRAVTTIIFSATSILLVALGTDLLTIITGVVFASISSGLGEITFLALSTRYKEYVCVELHIVCIMLMISWLTSRHIACDTKEQYA